MPCSGLRVTYAPPTLVPAKTPPTGGTGHEAWVMPLQVDVKIFVCTL